MFNRLLGRFSKDLAVDLGTSNTRVFVSDRGIVMHEPSVVAMNTRTGQMIAVGTTAKDMMGKTPPHIVTTRPLTKGVISDFDVTENMLKYFVEKAHEDVATLVPRPRMVMTVPLEMTEVERKAVEDAAISAGAREVFLVEVPLASAIGAGLPVEDAVGNMIVDIGGGTTQIAVIALGGIVTWRSISVAGDEMTKAIMQYARDVLSLLVGERVAEEVKWRIGSAAETGEVSQMEMRGRYVLNGLPREVLLQDSNVRDALYRCVQTIIEHVKTTLERTPPEIVADIYERGIVLVGGGALLRGLERTLAREVDIPVRVADDPTTAAVRGAGALLADEQRLRAIALPPAMEFPRR